MISIDVHVLGLWTKPNCVVKGTSTTVKDLQEGKKYAFRVKAVNIYGTSEPLEGDSFTAKNPFGEMHIRFWDIDLNCIM